MPLFLEPSAWVRLYIQQEGSDTMRALFTRPEFRADGFFASPAVALEMYGAIAKDLRVQSDKLAQERGREPDKRRRQGLRKRLERGLRRQYRDAVQEFEIDYAGIEEVEITRETYERAMYFANAAPDLSISGMDWLHLAAAWVLSGNLRSLGAPHNVILVVSDAALKGAARAQGVQTFDPIHGDPSRIRPLDLLP